MNRKLDLLLMLFFTPLLCLQTTLVQELTNEEWDTQYDVWEIEFKKQKTFRNKKIINLPKQMIDRNFSARCRNSRVNEFILLQLAWKHESS